MSKHLDKEGGHSMKKDLNKEFAELNNIHWHDVDCKILRCKCGVKGQSANPKYTDVKSIMEVMDKRKDGKLFYAVLMYGDNPNVEAIDDDGYIDRDYILNPSKFLIQAIEFCRKHKKEA